MLWERFDFEKDHSYTVTIQLKLVEVSPLPFKYVRGGGFCESILLQSLNSATLTPEAFRVGPIEASSESRLF